eukprot:SAG31_NODE_1808_length_7230_cov_32.785835_6_plen_124_part_00
MTGADSAAVSSFVDHLVAKCARQGASLSASAQRDAEADAVCEVCKEEDVGDDGAGDENLLLCDGCPRCVPLCCCSLATTEQMSSAKTAPSQMQGVSHVLSQPKTRCSSRWRLVLPTLCHETEG